MDSSKLSTEESNKKTVENICSSIQNIVQDCQDKSFVECITDDDYM